MWLVEILRRPNKESIGFFELTNEQIASWHYRKNTISYDGLMFRLSLGEDYQFAVWYVFENNPQLCDDTLYGEAVHLA